MSAFSYEKHLDATFLDTLFHMSKNGQFLPKPHRGYSIEVREYGCTEGGFNMDDRDEILVILK